MPTITTPAMIVQAREDDLSSLKNPEYLQRHLGGLVDTLILNDSYHIVTVDRQRDLLIDATVAYATLLSERIKLQQGMNESYCRGRSGNGGGQSGQKARRSDLDDDVDPVRRRRKRLRHIGTLHQRRPPRPRP